MFFYQRFIPGLAVASYIVGDEKSKRCAVIDPTRDVDEFLNIACKEKLTITDICETHVHADYVSGARELKSRLNDLPVIHASGMGGAEWTPAYADHVVKDGDEIKLGTIRLRAMHTPGHTPEHISWQLFDDTRSQDTPWLIFTGDFVFVGDVGRPDLLGEQERAMLAHQLFQSIFQRLAPLPDFVEIFPSHGAGSLCGKAIGSRRSSSLGFERKFNASLQSRPESDWSQTLLKGMPLAPPYFKRMKRINRDGPAILGERFPGQTPLAASQIPTSAQILDTRPEEVFAQGHIPGSINIALSPQLSTWAGWVLNYDQPIVIVPNSAGDVGEIVTQLIRVGFDRIDGYVDGNLAGAATERMRLFTVQQLEAKLNDILVLDVRAESEWEGGHIDHAKHIHAGLISAHLSELPRDKDIAVICGSGFRSSIAGSILLRSGFSRVASVVGGMAAWDRLMRSRQNQSAAS